MKKLLVGALLSLLSVSSALAQNFEFETVRTPDAPGFFMVRLFAGPGNEPLPIQDTFVQNYPDSEADLYAQLLPLIREFAGKVITREEYDQMTPGAYDRVIFLGQGDAPTDLFFRVDNQTDALEEFSNFMRTYLGPVFMQDITADFGGNVSEIFPETIPYLGSQEAFFIGKFEKPMKTRMAVRGIWSEGELTASAPLNLQDPGLAENPLAFELPDIWEAFWKAANEPQGRRWNLSWALGLFPVILLVLGIIVVFLAFRRMREQREYNEAMEQMMAENGPYGPAPTAMPADRTHTPVKPAPQPQTQPAPAPWDENNLPFEVQQKQEN